MTVRRSAVFTNSLEKSERLHFFLFVVHRILFFRICLDLCGEESIGVDKPDVVYYVTRGKKQHFRTSARLAVREKGKKERVNVKQRESNLITGILEDRTGLDTISWEEKRATNFFGRETGRLREIGRVG